MYQLEAVSAEHASLLADFAGERVVVEVKLHGLDDQDRAITFRPFVFPLEICEGCLARCSSELISQMLTREDVAMGQCDDNSGSDGRICWDPNC